MWIWTVGGREADEGEGRGGGAGVVHEGGGMWSMLQGEVYG